MRASAHRLALRSPPRLALALLALAAAGAAQATDWAASLDLRLVNSDADRSFMNGGLGAVRFDRDDAALQLGRARFALTQSFAEIWSAHLDASVWDDKDAHRLGVTEAYLQLRPYPRNGYRLRVKAGAFYPPVSLENRASGWESPYTLSYSAINSWFATEVRTLGAEAQLEWLGTRQGHAFDLALTAAVFGWNDQAGVVLAGDGFLLHDRQTPLAGRVGQPGVPPLYAAKPFLELDGRPGAYAGIEARYLDRLVLRVLRYDNRADASEIDSVAGVIAWNTTFTSAGARLETQGGWTFIAQGSGRADLHRPAWLHHPVAVPRRLRTDLAQVRAPHALGAATTASRWTCGERRTTAGKADMPGPRPTCSTPARTGACRSSGCAWRVTPTTARTSTGAPQGQPRRRCSSPCATGSARASASGSAPAPWQVPPSPATASRRACC